MSPRSTTVVFVPGAWHSPDTFDAVIAPLREAGYDTAKVYTPSVLRDGNRPILTFGPDVDAVRQQLNTAIDAGQRVIVVMHSYGGHCGSQACEGLDQASMVAQGHSDGRGVTHLVYLASFMLREGESPARVQPAVPEWLDIREDGTALPSNPENVFYNDFESQFEVDQWIAQLNRWSLGPFTSVLSHEPWRKIPTTYLMCEDDNAISISWQRDYVRNAIAAGAVDMRAISWKCGHTPYGTRPLEVSQLIRNTVEK